MLCFARATAQDSYKAGDFDVTFGAAGITSIKSPLDPYNAEFLKPGRSLGDLVIHYRPAGEEKWKEAVTAGMDDQRQVRTETSGNGIYRILSYRVGSPDKKWLKLTEKFSLNGSSIVWSIRLQNLAHSKVEIGDLGFPLMFNNTPSNNPKTIFEKRVIKHDFISGDGSFLFWLHPNGRGPVLVMTVMPGTHLEYFNETDQVRNVRRDFYVYIHSAVANGEEKRGTWWQPCTSKELAPAGADGDAVTYAFKLSWASDYQHVRDVLYEDGVPDVRVVPGMTVPDDLYALVAIRSKSAIDSLEPQFPSQTAVTYVGEPRKDTRIYKVAFSRLGENKLTVHFGKTRKTYLDFFVTEPLETLIKKRSAFLVDHQQHRDPSKWYNGLFSVWDMRHSVLRGPDNTDGFDGWWGYVLAADDSALSKGAFLADENVHYPNEKEIAAIEYYLKNFVWGGLQRTDKEHPYPYGIYGVPNWYVLRHSIYGFDSGGKGLEHIWRLYDYPHIILLYYDMYRIARENPQLVHYLDAEGYLDRAVDTAKAYFTYPYEILPWYETYKWGAYNELVIPKLIHTLREVGRVKDADWLTAQWERKVKYFIYDDPYPFRSEYSFDTTAYESTEAIGRWALDHPLTPDHNLWYDKNLKRWYSHPNVSRAAAVDFMKRQMDANLACRGTIAPTFYYLGSDIRGDSAHYDLSYMSQMGGWAILDYALYFADNPTEYLRIGYASYLSSWALMNTGTAASNYGYWYPGKANDGAAGWGYEPLKWTQTWIRKEQGRGAWFYDGEIDLGFTGALRGAATIITHDPLFGTFAYGGILTTSGNGYSVVPRDGVRQRFHDLADGHDFHMLLNRDGFAADKAVYLERDLRTIRFTLEDRGSADHHAVLRLQGLPAGSYVVERNGKPLIHFSAKPALENRIDIPVVHGRDAIVEIEREK